MPKGGPISDATIARAIEVFVRGFSFTRSFTHPFISQQIGPLWVVRDGPRKSGDHRNEEWMSHRIPPKEVDRIARKNARGRFAICAMNTFGEPDDELRTGFKSLGYRLRSTEALMEHDLGKIPRFDSPAKIERVMTQELADQLAKVARSRQILPEYLKDDAPLRQYIAKIDGKLVGWVRSITVGDATWCSNMYVDRNFRRRGIGKALMGRMLKDDRVYGAKTAVLTANHTGAMLYPVVGYRQIATLLMFMPKRSKL